MARPLRIQFEGALYRLAVRANNREPLFRDNKDRRKYLELLSRYRDQFGCRIYAYLLMTRFAQLLLETPRGNISKVMQCIGTSYTSYFNRRYRRRGTLFEGRYKSFLIDKENSLPEVTRCIHRRYLKANSGRKRDYSWSSYPIYLGRAVSNIVETEPVLTRFGRRIREQRKRYRRFVEREREGNAVAVQIQPGTAQFLSTPRPEIGFRDDHETPLKKAERLLLEIELRLACAEASELRKGRRALARHIAMYVIRSETALSLRSIGELLGVKAPAVAVAIGKVRELLKQDNFSNTLVRLLDAGPFSSLDRAAHDEPR